MNGPITLTLVPPPRETVSKEYRCWVRMLHRCHNEEYAGYNLYGGRGIFVCDAWRASYLTFLKDMGRVPPGPDVSIDRIDNDGPYSPENCRWTDRITQANNRTSNVTITYRGRAMTMANWARYLGITRKVLWKRFKLGWSVERALSPWPQEQGDEQKVAA